ncbi:hypothetical protein NM688_g516 [Phlebia brevispora]|uniref:Uncharacterized protein n=1 Tax=Phlebia brevispora TaxID=194682 RepID=A0ACC1TEE6_9APHY|nr:hypothetical protein NM688_g516 [Phlebia brevispora]
MMAGPSRRLFQVQNARKKATDKAADEQSGSQQQQNDNTSPSNNRNQNAACSQRALCNRTLTNISNGTGNTNRTAQEEETPQSTPPPNQSRPLEHDKSPPVQAPRSSENCRTSQISSENAELNLGGVTNWEQDLQQENNWSAPSPPRQTPIQDHQDRINELEMSVEYHKNEVLKLRQQVRQAAVTAQNTQPSNVSQATHTAGDKCPTESSSNSEPAVKKTKANVVPITAESLEDTLDLQFLQLGKEFAVTYMMWLPSSKVVWRYVTPSASADDEETSAQPTSKEAMTMAQEAAEMIKAFVSPECCQSLSLSKYRKRAGMSQIRFNTISRLAEHHAEIFGIFDPKFKCKSTRSTLAQVKHLLEDDRYLYHPDTNLHSRNGALMDGLFQHPFILQVLKLTLWEPHSLQPVTDKNPKNTNGALWTVDTVTDGMIAFAVTCIYCILLADSLLESAQFDGYYNHSLELLETYSTNLPVKYKKFMQFYTDALFGKQNKDQTELFLKIDVLIQTTLQAAVDDVESGSEELENET